MFDAPLTAKVWQTAPVFAKHQPTELIRVTLKGLVGDGQFDAYPGLVGIAERGKGSAASIRIPSAEAGCSAALSAQLEGAETEDFDIDEAIVTSLRMAGGDEGPEFTLNLVFTATDDSVLFFWRNRRKTCLVTLKRVQLELDGME